MIFRRRDFLQSLIGGIAALPFVKVLAGLPRGETDWERKMREFGQRWSQKYREIEDEMWALYRIDPDGKMTLWSSSNIRIDDDGRMICA